MSDDVRQAAFIGAAINKGLGSFPTLSKKKKKSDKDKKSKTSTSEKTETQSTQTSKPSKPAIEPPSEPIFVKSERINKTASGSKPNAIISNPSPSSSLSKVEKKPNVGKQFKDFGDVYGSTHGQPPIDLSKF